MTDLELLERAQFGKQIEAFWGSDIGNYLHARAQDCYNAALAELKTVDPTDAAKVMRLQGEIWKAEVFQTWLSEAVIDGLKALELLDEGEQE